MRIVILVSYNEQLVKRAFGFVVYACMQPCSHAAMQPCSHAAMQPCSHADRRVVALVASLLYVLVLLRVSHCLLCVGAIAHVVLSLCVLVLLCTSRCFCVFNTSCICGQQTKESPSQKNEKSSKSRNVIYVY